MKLRKTVPMPRGEQLTDLASTDSAMSQTYSESQQFPLSPSADDVATMQRNVQWYTERDARYRALVSWQQELVSSLDPYKVAQTVIKAVTALIDVPFVVVWEADEKTRTLRAETYSETQIGRALMPSNVRFGVGYVGHVAITRQSLDIPDIFASTSDEPKSWWSTYHFSSLYAVPILFNNTLYGVLAFYGDQPLQRDAETEEFLDQILRQAAIAMHNAALHASALTILQQVAQIAAASAAASSAGDRKPDETPRQQQGSSSGGQSTQRLNLIRRLLMGGSAMPPSLP